jgi:2-keto-3-deoxy-L-arabinonate dehydratase
MADLDAGATGAMTGGGYPDGIRQIVDAFSPAAASRRRAAYARWLPLINYENRQCGLIACKALMKEGGVIRTRCAESGRGLRFAGRHVLPALR